MEGHHTVEKQIVLPFGNNLSLAILRDENGKLLQVRADEIPDTLFCARFQFESLLKATVGFVGRDNKVFIYNGTGILDSMLSYTRV